MNRTLKPFYKRAWFISLIAILLLLIVVATVYFSCYEIQKTIIRIVCDEKNPSVPSNYPEILARTTKVSDLKYDTVFENGYLDIISPIDKTKPMPLVVYIHGGYYVGGDKLSKEPYCRVIADKGFVVANINYVLAPEEKYPSQLIQANTAIAYLMQNATTYNIDTTNVFIGGDSAGGHLSGQLGCLYTNPTFAANFNLTPSISASQLKGVLLLCGFFNIYTARATNFPLLDSAMWMFCGERNFEKTPLAPMINTISNVTKTYPNTYLICGDKDPFYQQNIEMRNKLNSLNISVSDYLPTSTKTDLKHEFQSKFNLDECAIGLDKLFAFLDSHIA